ncbi:MAG: hypothetical protein ABI947_17720 [Chloroflexota bacterium]
MYGWRGRSRGRAWVWLFVFFVLAMVFSGGMHRLWFFAWPLFFIVPALMFFGVMMFLRRWSYAQHWHEFGDQHNWKHDGLDDLFNEYHKDKTKHDENSEIHYF